MKVADELLSSGRLPLLKLIQESAADPTSSLISRQRAAVYLVGRVSNLAADRVSDVASGIAGVVAEGVAKNILKDGIVR